MKKKDYQEMTEKIVSAIGSKDNISSVTHCMTRLRLNVKDKGLVDEETAKNVKGVKGSNWMGDQLQLIIGPEVIDMYKVFCETAGLENQEAVNENLDKPKLSFGRFFDIIAGSMTAVIPVMCGAGFIKLLLFCLPQMGILDINSGTYAVFSFASDAGYYFLPIFLGYSTARKIGADISLGMLMGAILVSPVFVSAVTSGTALNVFGIHIYPSSYSYTLFPAILGVLVMKVVYDLFNRIIPQTIKTITVPFLTIVVMVPVLLCVLAPIGAFLGTYICNAVVWFYGKTGFIGVAVLAAAMPYIIITGTHGAFGTYMFTMLTTVGYDPLYVPAMIINNISLGAAGLGVAFKTKNKERKAECTGYSFTALIGSVTEPVLYGCAVKYKTPLIATTIGNFVGGALMGIFHLRISTIPGTGALLSFPLFMDQSLPKLFIAWGAGMITTFIITIVLYKDKEEKANGISK